MCGHDVAAGHTEPFWFGVPLPNVDEFETSRATMATPRKHDFGVTCDEGEGSHTRKNWREYLHTFAPLLFQ